MNASPDMSPVSRANAGRRPGWMLRAQLAVAVAAFALLIGHPPANGRMLIVSLASDDPNVAARFAIENGARLIASGPLAGSMIVDGRRDTTMRGAFGAGMLVLAAPGGGCSASKGISA